MKRVYLTSGPTDVLAIYLLGKVCEDMLSYGVEKMRREIDIKAEMLYLLFESHAQLEPFVKEPGVRSKTVIVGENPPPDNHQILSREEIVIGSGYGTYRDQHIRIANFPQHSVEHVERLIKLGT